MKLNKTLMIFSMLLVLLISLSAVSAEDVADDIVSSDIVADEIQSIDNDVNDVLTNESRMVGLRIDVNSTPYNEDAIIEVSVSDTNTTVDYNGTTVYLTIDGEPLGNVTINSERKGTYVIPAETYDVGTYYVMGFIYADFTAFKGVKLNIEKVMPIVNVENVTVKSGEIVTIPVNVTDNKGKGISGDVIISIFWENDCLTKYVKITNGTAKTPFNLTDIIGIFGENGTFDIGKLIGGNGTFNISSLIGGNGTLNISSLIGENGTIDFGRFANGTTNITIGNTTTFDVSSLLNGTFSLGNKTFDIGGIINGTTPITIGNTTIDFSNLFNRGNKTTTTDDKLAISILDDKLADSTFDLGSLLNGTGIGGIFGNGTFSIGNNSFNISSLLNGTFSIGNSSFNISSLLNGTNISIGNTTLDLGGLLNGTGINITDLLNKLMGKGNNTFAYLFAPGTYDISVTYLSNRNYEEATNNTAKLIITPRSILTAEDVVMYYKNGTRYVVNLTDTDKKPMANETVTIVLNGVSYERTTDENGTASIALNLPSGNYTASASYGFGHIIDSTVENNITILSTVYGDDLVKVFRNESQYYATFLDGQGNPLANGTEVNFNINGVFYTRTVSGNEGKAKLNINLEQGEYVITAINPVTGENAANNITVIAKIVDNEDLVMYYRNGSKYSVTLLGNDGKPVAKGETVTFNINGVFYDRQTDDKGVASLNLNLQPGDYVVTAMYEGCNVANNITILPVLSAENLSMTYNDESSFVANLVDGQGKPYADQKVTFNLNGELRESTTNSNGQAALKIDLMPGEYIVTSTYNEASISNTITVKAQGKM